MRRALLVLVLLLPALAVPASAEDLPPVGEPVARKTWTWTVVDERGIALGGGGLAPDDVEDLRARGFGAVLNFRGEAPEEGPHVEAAGMDYLLVGNGFPEDDPMTAEDLERAVAFIEQSLAEGKPVYVHCRGGWHRSAAAVVAFFMKENQWRFEEAFEHLAERRPGVEARAADGLLAYEAKLFGEEKLDIDLWSARWRIDPDGERMPVHAYVTHDGVPVEGAKVTLVQEYDEEAAPHVGTTDADGRVDFEVDVRGGGSMRYVSALAEMNGFIDGYDRNVFWLRGAEDAAPTVLEAPDEVRAEPGAPVNVTVKANEGDAKTNARVTATLACATVHRDYTGWDGRTWIQFTAPALPGTYDLTLRVNRFATEPVTHVVRVVVGDGGPPASCGALAAAANGEVVGPDPTPAVDTVPNADDRPSAVSGPPEDTAAPANGTSRDALEEVAAVGTRPSPAPAAVAVAVVAALLLRRRAP